MAHHLYSGGALRSPGRRRDRARVRVYVGCSPACAGTTGTPSRSSRIPRVEPRVRGDKTALEKKGWLQTGGALPRRARP